MAGLPPTVEIPRAVPADQITRLRVTEWREMSLTARQALVARCVGILARKATEQGLRFRYWPRARVRWLVPEGDGSHVLIDAHPTMRGEATFIDLIVSTEFAADDPRALSAIFD